MVRAGDTQDSGMLSEEPSCLAWEAQIAELAEGSLAPLDEAALREHAAACPHCGSLLEEATAGRGWVRMLRTAPHEAPEALLERILAQTSHAGPPAIAGGPLPGLAPMPDIAVLPSAPAMVLHGQREARILMTAAMAIFSIAITFSMTGARLGSFHATTVAASASRQFFDTKKQVVSFYDNLRLVREVEATVEDMRRSPDEAGKRHERRPAGGPSARHSQEASPAATLLASRTRAEERTRL